MSGNLVTVAVRLALRGACRDQDPELFFPIGSSGPAVLQAAQAKAVCAGCPVRIDCLNYAIESGQAAGVWGGASEEERRAIRPAAPAGG
jgi:WhiB family redox-sensing transcriptional regulator